MNEELLNFGLPYGIEKWNRALRGVYMGSRRDFLAGKKFVDVPYEDHKKPSGLLSWSRAYIRAMQRITGDSRG